MRSSDNDVSTQPRDSTDSWWPMPEGAHERADWELLPPVPAEEGALLLTMVPFGRLSFRPMAVCNVEEV